MFGKIKYVYKNIARRIAAIEETNARALLLSADIRFSQYPLIPDKVDLHSVECSVWSQAGDDGILQYLCTRIPVLPEACIELGCGDYSEANTRFLVWRNNWSALLVDASEAGIRTIRESAFAVQRDIICVNKYITEENINDIVMESGIGKNIGILHIDLEGNNYWIWRALKCVRPIAVSVEYNSVFGPERSITIPYDAGFNRHQAHYSGLYFSASLQTFRDLADEKGYVFIGSNSYGTTAYFVLRGYEEHFHIPGPGEGYVRSKFRESRDEAGSLSFLRGEDRYLLIAGLPVVNTRTGAVEAL